MAAEHSPLPWRVVKSRGLNSYELRSAGGAYLADLWGVDMPVPNGVKVGEVKANAAFLVCCVNSHAALVEALRVFLARWEVVAPQLDGALTIARLHGCVYDGDVDVAPLRAALALEEGRTSD